MEKEDDTNKTIVHGLKVGSRTECAHWHSDRDIIAIRHKCCGEFYACITCHDALAGHPPIVWSKGERHVKAVLCGNCQKQLTIAEYLSSENICPSCQAAFNPGCSKHYSLYFEM
ncbi:hypothetical protein TWF694_005692 [Orbilia ellipsospora]|uniref:CHY-type domain-containing protein n=1 Tax=Orbilia ellipsospora TaxID=2528407 RepID=A0AAV9WTA2_9PEZI